MTRLLRPIALLTALLFAAVALPAPAQGSLIYDDCFALLALDITQAEPARSPIGTTCIQEPGNLGHPGTDGDGAQPVPADRYLDLTTNLVYEQTATGMQPVGVSNAALGYAYVQAYPPSAEPVPMTADDQGACVATYFCVSFNVALLGAHSVTVQAQYDDACQSQPETLFDRPAPAPGTPFTDWRGVRISGATPPPKCIAGTVTVLLIIDGVNNSVIGVYYGTSATTY